MGLGAFKGGCVVGLGITADLTALWPDFVGRIQLYNSQSGFPLLIWTELRNWRWCTRLRWFTCDRLKTLFATLTHFHQRLACIVFEQGAPEARIGQVPTKTPIHCLWYHGWSPRRTCLRDRGIHGLFSLTCSWPSICHLHFDDHQVHFHADFHTSSACSLGWQLPFSVR